MIVIIIIMNIKNVVIKYNNYLNALIYINYKKKLKKIYKNILV
jgi:hypothetical protein